MHNYFSPKIYPTSEGKIARRFGNVVRAAPSVSLHNREAAAKGVSMPPVNPRVSTVLTEAEVEKLKAIAEKYDLTVAWLVRAAINHVLVESEQERDRFIQWLHEARA